MNERRQEVLARCLAFEIAGDAPKGQQRPVFGALDLGLHGQAIEGERGACVVHAPILPSFPPAPNLPAKIARKGTPKLTPTTERAA